MIKLISSHCSLAVLAMFVAGAGHAQSGKPLDNDQLVGLTKNGITLQLGGEGTGYTGSLKLSRNGKGKGSATMDDGNKISIVGTWAIKDGKFCRTWSDLDGGKEVCEHWYPTSGRSVDVYNGNAKLGVNSW